MNYEASEVYIDNCSSESEIGIILDSDILFDNLIDKVEKKAHQTLGMIKRTSTFFNKSVSISLCKALVRQHLEHGNVILYLRHRR